MFYGRGTFDAAQVANAAQVASHSKYSDSYMDSYAFEQR